MTDRLTSTTGSAHPMSIPDPASGDRPTLSRRALLAGGGAVAVAVALPFGGTPAVAEAVPAVARGPLTLGALKDLSERVRPILERHFPESLYGEIFLAEEGENYHGLKIECGCPKLEGKRHYCPCQSHPLAGTPMLGAVSGYYEPEWDEETLYESFERVIHWTDKPDSMTDAEWAEALALTGMTPASHAERLANLEREMMEAEKVWDSIVSEAPAPGPGDQGGAR